MSRLASAFVAVFAIASAVGCASVPADKYARDLDAIKRYAAELERQNQDLLAQNESLNRQVDHTVLAKTTDELYGQLARQLQSALDALKTGEGGDMRFNPRTGAWEMGTDLLFESGSDKISAQGKEILKKFAEAHKAKSYSFRIVGHTDRAPITRTLTKERLDTDTNMELSADRAIAVMGALIGFGIPESAFAECVGKGNREPVATNDRSAGNMKKNRRVEIYVLSSSGAMNTSAPKRDTTTK
jgi:flagellar motor protein MotB